MISDGKALERWKHFVEPSRSRLSTLLHDSAIYSRLKVSSQFGDVDNMISKEYNYLTIEDWGHSAWSTDMGNNHNLGNWS